MTPKVKNHLATNDDILKPIINQVKLPELDNTHNVFNDLMSCIIEQQIHYRSTKKTFQKMLDAANITELSLNNFSTFEEKSFKNIKLSANKYETISRILEFFEANDIDWQKSDDTEVRKIFSQIKGIGPWTIDMLLLYTLERPNIFPADDYHLKNMMIKMYPIDTSVRVKAQLKAVAEQWAPYKSFAVRYLLEWKIFQKKASI